MVRCLIGNRFKPAMIILTALTAFLSVPTFAFADDDAVLLRYKLDAGTKLHYRVKHVAKTQTEINGKEEISNSTTISRRHWDVRDRQGDQMTFDHVLDGVTMNQSIGDADPTQWTSDSDEDVPDAFAAIADKIGSVLSTITINDRGQEVTRQSETKDQPKTDLGMGSLALPLPPEPIAIGESWSVPRQIRVREGEEQKIIKINERYTLDKLQTGIATIIVRSEPITPIRTQAVRAQVVQQMSNGEIRFDVDNGHVVDKRLDWDENVVSFRGPNSSMNYRAQLIETMVSDAEVQQAQRDRTSRK